MLVYLLFFFILDMLTGQLWVFQASMTLQRLWMLVKCLAVRRKGGLNWHSFYCLSSFISIGKSVKIQQEKCLYNITLPHLHGSFHFNTCQENKFISLIAWLLTSEIGDEPIKEICFKSLISQYKFLVCTRDWIIMIHVHIHVACCGK